MMRTGVGAGTALNPHPETFPSPSCPDVFQPVAQTDPSDFR
jgi:hypothetical protein